MGEHGKKVTGSREKTELLNSFFASFFMQKERKDIAIKSNNVGYRAGT